MGKILERDQGFKPAGYYALVCRRINELTNELVPLDPATTGYMVMRAAMLMISFVHGPQKAAELAYSLADQFASEPEE